MTRLAGVPNKITSEVKDKLQLLIDDLIASLNVNELDTNQRIKMLQIVLQFTLPRIKQATNEVSEDLMKRICLCFSLFLNILSTLLYSKFFQTIRRYQLHLYRNIYFLHLIHKGK